MAGKKNESTESNRGANRSVVTRIMSKLKEFDTYTISIQKLQTEVAAMDPKKDAKKIAAFNNFATAIENLKKGAEDFFLAVPANFAWTELAVAKSYGFDVGDVVTVAADEANKLLFPDAVGKKLTVTEVVKVEVKGARTRYFAKVKEMGGAFPFAALVTYKDEA